MEITTYSNKQAGVIYRAVKEGRISMEKSSISMMYDMVGSFTISFNANVIENQIAAIKLAVDAIFNNDYASAQSFINSFCQA